ncbi:hypothetical protein [Halovivax gelatinilyticus]|uniref:hypothetical protein n=1 Tax=Halovivax gelatinilyticus TaxID=2961597 RepID=UPI0020CA3979|nr:hypothetical protein [Halovivax gelatinilyticus]
MVNESGVGGAASDVGVGSLVAVYRHDVHKLRGRRHGSGVDEFAGVRVNEAVPLGADRDAALLSRPSGEPEQTVSNHASPYRLSLLSGESVGESGGGVATAAEVEGLVCRSGAERLHAAWLTSDVASLVNESVCYPYTSLKFHVLLAGALLDCYRAGYGFDELFLEAVPGEACAVRGGVDAAVKSGVVVPFRTVLWSPVVSLRVTGEPAGGVVARLGSGPARSFADTWSRLSGRPFEVDRRELMVLDAQLRRIRSWSVALQYIEDFVARFELGSDGVRGAWEVEG